MTLENRIECFAYELKTAWEAGLTLVGAEDLKPQWLGTDEQFRKWEELKANFENMEHNELEHSEIEVGTLGVNGTEILESEPESEGEVLAEEEATEAELPTGFGEVDENLDESND